MKMKRLGISLAALLAATSAGSAAMAQEMTADIIITDADIYTPDGWAQAMAIKDGVIIAVGDEKDINSFKSPGTQMIDAEGDAVLPGLHDLHVHPMGAGASKLQCRWTQGAGPDVVLPFIADCVAAKEKGDWVTGGQWDAASFGGTAPTAAMLDKVTPDNPAVFSDISGHSVWANSLALAAGGIDDDTPNPPGGVIERDADGHATGILRESGAALVRAQVAPASRADNATALKTALDEMLSYGITALTDAVVGAPMMQAYADLADDGKLKQRVRGCVPWRPQGQDASTEDPMSAAIQSRNLYARDRFRPDCIKVFLDGVPTDGHTAAMVEPYADATDPNDFRARGLLMVPPAMLNRAVTVFDAHGLTVKFHAAGDAAVREALDAIEAARTANGYSGIMHNPGHNSFVQMSDIKRARALGATFEMSPYIWYQNPIIPDIAKAIGPERMKRWIPVKDAIDAGALVVPGSDWNVVPSVNPWIALETLVTRKPPGNKGKALGAQEKITLEQAFDMFTVNAAIQQGQRNMVGTLEKGMRADLVIVDRNPFKIKIGDVHNTQVLKTMINGEVVYEK